jgi:hypothetical protein
MVLAVVPLAAHSHGGEPREGGEVRLTTPYLVHPAAGAHRVRIRGTLGGSAEVTLDTNECTLDAFGDVSECTRKLIRPRKANLKRLGVPDRAAGGRPRVLYDVAGLPEDLPLLRLVVPTSPGGPYRLLVLGPDGSTQRVIALEPEPS